MTVGLVMLTVAAHAAMQVLGMLEPARAEWVLERFAVEGGVRFEWWGLWTSVLLHGGWLHLAGNMLFLWVFGPAVEDRLGRLGFLLFYAAAAAASGGVHALIEVREFAFGPLGDPVVVGVPAIGASGAIAGVTAAYFVFFPTSRIKVLWLIGLAVMQAPAWWMVGLQVAWNLLAVGTGQDRGIAYSAHLGGYAFGAAAAVCLLAIRIVRSDQDDLVSILRHKRRRKQFRSASMPAVVVPRPVAAARERATDASIEAVAGARANVSSLISQGKFDEAADAYDALCRDHADKPDMLVLSRAAQSALAAHLYTLGRSAQAANAMQRFLAAYPSDREADAMRLLLSRLLRDRLGRQDEARALLEAIIQDASDPDLAAKAREELNERQESSP